MPTFLFRLGDGNEGCFPRFFVTLNSNDCPYAALRALVANQYIAGKRVRRFIVQNMETDGDIDFGIRATVYEGPDGESAYGAAWLCAEMNPATWTESPYPGWESGCWSSGDDGLQVYPLRRILDGAALRQYRAEIERKGVTMRFRYHPRDARAFLKANDIDKNFFTLGQNAIGLLLQEARRVNYRAPQNANGSRARYFHAYLTRLAARKES